MRTRLDGFVGFPDDIADKYRRDGYWQGRTLGELLRDHATDPGRIAIIDKDLRRWTYTSLDVLADRFAAGLALSGVTAGDRVVVQLSNRAEFAIISIGCFRLGAIPVYGLPGHRRREISYLARQSEAAALIVEGAHQGFHYPPMAAQVAAEVTTVRTVIVVDGDPAAGQLTFDEVLGRGEAEQTRPPGPDPDDVAFFLLSGGTTGLPKLIPRTHDDYFYQLAGCAAGTGMDANGCYLASLPVAHNAALGCPGLLGTLLVGGRVLLPDSPSPDDVFDLLEPEGVTLTTLMPPMVQIWREAREFFEVDMSQVVIQVGSAHMPPELGRAIYDEFGTRLTHWFGMAEGLLSFTRLDEPAEVAIHTQGRPLSAADELRIVDHNGHAVSEGQVGELLTRGPYTIRGYYRADDVNAEAFTADGFLRTGDLVRLTPAGAMVVEGRLKDVINKGGEKIIAGELEDVLHEHPGLRRTVVAAVSDSMSGETPCVFVESGADDVVPDLSEIRAFLLGRDLAPYKLPDRLWIVERFPRTPVGKIDKTELRRAVDSGG